MRTGTLTLRKLKYLPQVRMFLDYLVYCQEKDSPRW